MKRSLLITLVCAAAAAPTVAQTLNSLTQRLRAMHDYSATARFEVLLPAANDPVGYTVDLIGSASEADTLSPCKYLIRWSVPTPSGMSEGFSAYYDGHHFRFRDKRLQEYHAEWDMGPFAPGGKATRGVQQQVQFAELLPQFIGERLEAWSTDSTYTLEFSYSPTVTRVSGVQTIGGYDCLEFNYTFDTPTSRPVAVELEYNPGLVSEQSIAVTYDYENAPAPQPIDLESLTEMAPEAFSRYRESTFSIATLAGRRLPSFSAPRLQGERYSHHSADGFEYPTIVAVVDAAESATQQVIADVRDALLQAPGQTDVIWAFVSNIADDIAPLVAGAAPEETVLTSARGLARDTGATTTPVLIYCAPSGTVTGVTVGSNKDLRTDVIQNVMIASTYND